MGIRSAAGATSVVVCLLIVSSLAQSAAAQPKPAAAAAQESEYDRVLKEALAEFERANWTEARSLFERAHELQPSARTLRAIGLTAFEEKRYVAALVALAQALEDPRKPLTETQRREVEDAIRRARGFVAQYTLELSPEGAQLRVDDAAPVMLDDKLQLDPGSHELSLSAEGYETKQQRIVAQPRETKTLRIALAKIGSAERARANTKRVSVVAGDQGLTTLQYVGIGVGAAGVLSLGAMIYFGLQAQSKYDESGCADGGCADARAKALNDEALEAGTIATVTGIAGLALAGTGAFLIVWSPESESEPAASAGVQLALSPALTGLTLRGRL